eukprot:TRINITY_DN770_c0_g1_i2.p1 TRINITY_DN770_c0_g1~~TRINITY_DN770_c0_g1_i2.p1  ORF type:complete len:130 (-),score=11.29 TRINITY_DN770_c0_g1_i2:83-436(-)
MDETEESAFMVEGEVEPIVKSVIDLYLKDKMFDEKQLPHWINSICEDVVKQLSDLKKPFKYVVSCSIMQKNGAGVHVTNSCHWDAVNDGMCTIKWPGERQKDQSSMYCVVTVFGLMI